VCLSVYEKLINTLGLKNNISLLGNLNKDQMEDVFEEVWVQVVPSLWNEPFGIVTIEAMMRGTAVVASDKGGLKEIIDNGKSGILVSPGNANCLTEALLSILKDRDLALEMGQTGYIEASKKYTIENLTNGFIELYKKITTDSDIN